MNIDSRSAGGTQNLVVRQKTRKDIGRLKTRQDVDFSHFSSKLGCPLKLVCRQKTRKNVDRKKSEKDDSRKSKFR